LPSLRINAAPKSRGYSSTHQAGTLLFSFQSVREVVPPFPMERQLSPKRKQPLLSLLVLRPGAKNRLPLRIPQVDEAWYSQKVYIHKKQNSYWTPSKARVFTAWRFGLDNFTAWSSNYIFHIQTTPACFMDSYMRDLAASAREIRSLSALASRYPRWVFDSLSARLSHNRSNLLFSMFIVTTLFI